ncbi:MAG: PaaI family thioesterase [Ferruginibacter sp.]
MQNEFLQLVQHPVKFRMFLFWKLPSAFFSGVRVKYADEEKCIVTIRFKWFSQNPFKSTYFACLSMAAEMTTGVLGLAHIQGRKPAVSMLVVNIKGDFMKKAVGKTIFTCCDGTLIKQTIEDAITTGEGKTITAKSTGVNEQGEVVAVFEVTWSFKSKR